MDRVRLGKVFSSFGKNELPGVFERLGVTNEKSLKASTKRELVSSLVQKCVEANITPADVLQIELRYLIAHPNSTNWKAYKLEQSLPSSAVDIDPIVFRKRIQLYLGSVCNYDMTDAIEPSGHWLCFHIQDAKQTPYTCFILRSPPTPFILMAGVRKSHLAMLLEAMALTVECTGWTDVQLTGRNLGSIIDLLIHQYSQGPYSAYRLNQVDPNPLLAMTKKRRYQQSCDPSCKQDTKEDEVIQRHRAAKDVFGTNPLPKVERFTYKLEKKVTGQPEPIGYKVKLTGSSVFEGVKQCIACDLVTLPVPDSIACMTQLASNCMTVVAETTTIQSDCNDRSCEQIQVS